MAGDGSAATIAFNATNITCSRASLHAELVANHTVVIPYTSSSTDVWDALKVLDVDPLAASNVTLFYSRLSVDAAQEYNSGNGWTREHVWPQSLGPFEASSNDPPATDLHALRAAKQRCNSLRNNFKYGVVSAGVVEDAECRLACETLSDGRICEPIDAIKGEIARSLFYMDLRYRSSTSGEPWAGMTLSAVGSPTMFVEWNELYPPSDYERTRSELVRTQYQGVANPFVRQPALGRCFFGNGSSVDNTTATPTVAPTTAPLGSVFINEVHYDNAVRG